MLDVLRSVLGLLGLVAWATWLVTYLRRTGWRDEHGPRPLLAAAASAGALVLFGSTAAVAFD
ncbi:hypothetical protein [Conexibacter sp. SYSU D00693]|uniref:hypothetical protein n=1 Tax=Conexibacter sp. SYSU D00693 TaxID=2812560 RepID=UPI00196B50BC|nr:hypothetical protein [Conexibacter sp. SYSU D00693]